MSKFQLLVQSPRFLILFEAAARLGSFTHAANELGIQQPSVSSAIRQLEEALGVQLFLRGHRNVELTIAGERLFAGVSAGLKEIQNSVEAVQQMVRSDYVTLTSSSAFSHYWMMPRLSQLHAAHPEIDLRLQNSDREPNLDTENISLGIRLGNGHWQGCNSALIAKEIIYPVANPQVMNSAKNLRSIPGLLNERLIHLEEPIRKRPTWAQWFASHGVEDTSPRDGLRLNDYALVLQAAIAGEGFAFGWDHVARDLLKRGLLVSRDEWAWETGNGIYLVWSKYRPLSQSAKIVRNWIISVSDFPNNA